MIALGMMSGTSADGIDLAAVELEPGSDAGVRVLAHFHVEYPQALRSRILDAGEGRPTTAHELARLHAAIGDVYAQAAEWFLMEDDFALPDRRPAVIGMHGQTVAHLPSDHVGLQLGDPARVATVTQLPVVADLRSADLAAGGQGAPLVPFADFVLFGAYAPIATLNLGGIANLTIIPTSLASEVIAFDTGPANMVLDAIAESAGAPYDRDGAGARRGRIDAKALAEALAHPYFARRAPKSTGREEFGRRFAAKLLASVKANGGSVDDALATAMALTVRTIADGLRLESAPFVKPEKLLIAGGGARNPTLTEQLSTAVAPLRVETMDAYGVPSDYREAVAFAILAAYRLRGLKNTLPSATGAANAVSGGAVYLP